ncbi:MAG TPA: hypothetical protein VFF73_04695 [Planctomycetota bacterium]|nr:hypothetical protein [Planctomycetota bacterium]
MRRWCGALLLGVALVSTSGCAGFRAQFGGGIGLGADVKLPGLWHMGLSAGQYMNVGIRYDEPELSHDAEINAMVWHWEGRQSRHRGTPRHFVCEHACWGVLPPVTTTCNKDDLAIWDFEIGLNLLVIDLRLGFNPVRLVRPPKHQPEETEPAPVISPPPPTPKPVAEPTGHDYFQGDPLAPSSPGDPPYDQR